MGRKEKDELIKSMNERSKKATINRQAAVDYLIKLGILNKKGKPAKQYSELCITPMQG
jgi:hypothetical protein